MGFNNSSQDGDRSIDRKIGATRRRFMALLGAGAATAASVPTASAQEDDGQEPDMRDVMVSMTDNINLATDIYLPSESGSHPTILYRTPYNKGDTLANRYLSTLLENGYAVVKQDKRGRYKSEGEYNPVFFDQEDGYDSVEWAADQDWSTGSVGMVGHSYRAFTSWQAALADPPSLEAIVPIQSPANFYRGWQYKGGAFELGVNISWILRGRHNISRLPVSEDRKQELRADLQNPTELYEVLPINENPAFDEFVAPYYNEWLLHNQYDEYWERIDVNKHIEDVSAKVLSIGGFWDIFLEGHPAAFDAINERGQEDVRETQSMILGPWDHRTPSSDPVGERELPEEAGSVGDPEDIVVWFDQWLKDDESGESFPTVQYFQTGPDEWRIANQWPPEAVSSTEWYLNSDEGANGRSGDGVVSPDQPDDGSDADEYTYDPLDPTPTTGGPALQVGAQSGVVDQRDVEQRDDVLVFTSEELEESVDIVGVPAVKLYVESTAPDTDFGVKLVDVGPDGYAMNVTEGYLRARYRETSRGESFREEEFMDEGTVYEIDIDLRSTAHTFEADHRIRIDITSSNFPRLSRNPNRAMDVPNATRDDMQAATNTIYHGADQASYVSLPILEEYDPSAIRESDASPETTTTSTNSSDTSSDQTTQSMNDGGDSTTTDDESGASAPGFTAGSAAAGVGSAACLLKRRLDSESSENE